jgi:hypothetical protein
MTSPRVRSRVRNPPAAALATAVAVGLAAAGLTGCGDARAGRTPPLRSLPLAAGARVDLTVRQCDPGARGYCAVYAIIIDRRYRSSHDFLLTERKLLARARWTSSFADTGLERSAESPGHRLRLTYTTADDDLRAIDQHYVKRPGTITLRLSKLDFAGAPALSVTLQAGSS